MAKVETKTVTSAVAVPITNIVKQEPQQNTTPKATERTEFSPIRPQNTLSNQQDDRGKRRKQAEKALLQLFDSIVHTMTE